MDALASLVTGAGAPEARPQADSAARPSAATPGFGPALARAMSDANAANERTHRVTSGTARTIPAATEADAADAAENASATQSDAVAGDVDAALAAATASVTTKAAESAAGAENIQRSIDELVPEFKSRLDRVIARMRDEFGLEVRVVETFRSQARQDRLYAQGRSTTGPTVTWTRSSNHTLGRAADVRIEGAADDAAAYRLFARIAGEEGLRTLGPADPGHIELPPGVKGERTAAAPSTGQPHAGSLRVASVARVAHVAAPAGVAGVAHVARIATIAGTGGMTRVQASGAGPSIRGTSTAAASVVPSQTAMPPSGAASLRAVAAETRFANDPAAEQTDDTGGGARFDNGGGDDAFAALMRGTQQSSPDLRAASPAGANGTDIAARVARLVALQDAVQQAPTTGVTLLLNGEDGAIDTRIRLGLRGGLLETTIDVTDPLEAVRLAGRGDELKRILERRGLDPASVLIREAGESGAGWLPQAARTAQVRAQAEADNHDPNGAGRRDHGANEQRNGRRNAKEGRQ